VLRPMLGPLLGLFGPILHTKPTPAPPLAPPPNPPTNPPTRDLMRLSTTADSEAALLKTLRSLISETGQIGVDADESLASKIESVCGEVSH
jgi:hypothetical protein